MPALSPYGVVFRKLVAPRLGPPTRFEPAEPVRFAQGVGFAFLAVATVGYLSGAAVVGIVATVARARRGVPQRGVRPVPGLRDLPGGCRRAVPRARHRPPVRKPPAIAGGRAGSIDGVPRTDLTAPGLRRVLPRAGQPGRPLRRLVRHLRHVDRHLLPAVLPGDHAQAGQRTVPAVGRGRPAGRLPGLPALPAGCRARFAGLELPGRRGRPGHAAHRRRRRRPRRRAGARLPARLHRAPPGPDAAPPRSAPDRSPWPGRSGPRPARMLIETTTLGLAEIAFAAGFGSVRQFNDTIREIYGRTPSALRDDRDVAPSRASWARSRCACPTASRCTPDALLEFLAAPDHPRRGRGASTARYRRGLRLPHGAGAAVELGSTPGYVLTTLRLADVRDLAPAVARCRRLLDLDADPVAVDAVLAARSGARAQRGQGARRTRARRGRRLRDGRPGGGRPADLRGRRPHRPGPPRRRALAPIMIWRS